MLWEVEIRAKGRDAERERACDEFDLLTHSRRGSDLIASSSRGYLLEGKGLHEANAKSLMDRLLVDPLVESATLRSIGSSLPTTTHTVLLKPGVMDPVSQSVLQAAADLGIPVSAVRTFRRYAGAQPLAEADSEILFRKILANDAIERVVSGPLHADHLVLGRPYHFHLKTTPILALDDDGLMKVSREGTLALTIEEMRTIRDHFAARGREPTDIELETIAQTWSEHCSHKTLKGRIEYSETIGGTTTAKHFANMLKETIFAATVAIRQKLGAEDWCVSVFADNAGIVKFQDDAHLCIKVETHNRPSAIEPYGGANTGLGGVIRDVLGTGLGGKPVCNTDVFCFARPDYPPEELPPGVLHPRRTMQGVVAGVRDYGNRMGIPTVNGSILFDDRYVANPLVFCGTVGLIPVGLDEKAARPGDLIVAIGGRTGRDGIHGATFSSEGLHDESEKVSGGAVQIGNAIEEKKVLDVILQARDRRLYTAITDCGAGGFSSAVGEMAAELGASVRLEAAPLKYEGLSYTETWISESQERMVLSVPPEHWNELRELAAAEGVEASNLGTFEATGRLKLTYRGEIVGDLDLHFLHEGRPAIVRKAEYVQPEFAAVELAGLPAPQDTLLAILGTFTVCSKEWVIRQYDHEVQGGSVVKPLVGARDDGPSDAAVVMPILGRATGFAISNGLNPRYADLDPYWGAAAAIDEAVRNAVAVGADPARIAILDNFCWGNVTEPAMLGALVRTAVACRDVAIAFGTPFVSGKDSLNNSYSAKDGRRIAIPHTLLITALGIVHDVSKCATMDFKESGNDVYILGNTFDELGGSHLLAIAGMTGGTPPRVNLELAPKIFAKLHAAIARGWIRACHDCSEGGLAVALAEMAFSGEVGLDATLSHLPGGTGLEDIVKLFAESATRFVLEAKPENASRLREHFAGLPFAKIGTTVAEQRLRIAGSDSEWLIWSKLGDLKAAWQKPLNW